jgi:phospholipid/cholesterol/gamma-HCH transport system substrate-binding protein
MKISNETKVGALTVVAVVFLILGYNFLKGKDLFTPTNTFYASFPYNPGLSSSNPIYYNGFKVGTVTNIDMVQKPQPLVIVEFTVRKKYVINNDAVVACFAADVFGAKALKIYDGTPTAPIAHHKDTLKSTIEQGVIETLSPVLSKAEQNISSFLTKLDTSFTKDATKDLNVIIANIKNTTESIQSVALKLNMIVASEQERINITLTNAQEITENLKKNNENITSTITNLKKTSDQLAQVDFKKTMGDLQTTVDGLKDMLNKINSGQGTLGQLANDKKLYDNLTAVTNNLDSLLKDLKEHPWRYFRIRF